MEQKKRKSEKPKTTKILLNPNDVVVELEKKYFEDDNNFIDYFLIIGAKPEICKCDYLYKSNSPDEINDNLIPQIISKFPNFDKKNVVVESTMINQIFPKGFKIKESETQPEPYFYCLVLDNQLYSAIYTRKYLSCLIIYESIEKYKILNDNYKSEENESEFMKIIRNVIKSKKEANSPQNYKYKKYYIPKCLCIVSVHPHIDKFEDILRTVYDLSLSNNYPTLFMDHIIEKLIIETPKIPRGLKRIILKFPNKEIELTEKKMNELPSVNINLAHTFDILSANNVVGIYKYLLYETKIIFFSENLYNLTNTILSFLILLYPFNYQFQTVSILPKQLYGFLETVSPFVFGINEKYKDNFFKKNKITFELTTICIVDIDNDTHFLIAPGGELNQKDFPEIPKKLKKKIDDKLKFYYLDKRVKRNCKEELNGTNSNKINIANFHTAINPKKVINKTLNYNNNVLMTLSEKIEFTANITRTNNRGSQKSKQPPKLKNDSEKIQEIFFKFMRVILKDYPKFLSKDYSVNLDISMSIKDMFDKENYLKLFNNEERCFYEKIFSTQMFIEFIYKRMMPKDCNEKVEILFFEEKINEKYSQKFFSKNTPQNILLPCKDYDFDENNILKIDLCPENSVTQNLYNFLITNKNLLPTFLNKGYQITINKEKNTINFNYTLFPCFYSEKLFILNTASYLKGSLPIYKEIEAINTKIVNKSSMRFIQTKNMKKSSEGENDLYLCYLILWSLFFWYIKKGETDYRFLKMLEILEKIEEHDIKIFELLFKVLVDGGNENDENVIILYKKFIHFRLNPSWDMFSLVSKIIKKKQNAKKKKNMLHQDTNFKDLRNKFLKENKIRMDSNEFERSIKIEGIDDLIYTDTLLFYAYVICKKCGKVINLGEICSNLNLLKTEKDKNGLERIKCINKSKDGKICENLIDHKFRFRFGKEIFNQRNIFNMNNKYYSSILNNINLLSPKQLKEKLFEIAINNIKNDKTDSFDIPEFRNSYPDIYWSLIWYFGLNEIDQTLILPYNYLYKNEKNKKEKNKDDPISDPNIQKYFSIKEKISDDNSIINNPKTGGIKFIKAKTSKQKILKSFTFFQRKFYDVNDLCIQNVHEIAIIDNYGIFTLKNFLQYKKNITFNEIPLLPFDKDNNSTCCGSVLGFDDITFRNSNVTAFSHQPINRTSNILPMKVNMQKYPKSGPGISNVDDLNLRISNLNTTQCIVFESDDEDSPKEDN